MPLVSVNGTAINYELDGPEAGLIVMLSNSLASNLTMWDDQMKPLMEAGYGVLRYDSRGHGQSAVPDGPYTIQMLASDALGLLDALALKKVHFCGLSMGGMVGQVLAARHGDRLLSLALCDTSSHKPPREIWEERIETVSRDGMQAVVDMAIDRWFTKAGQKRLPEAVARARRMMLDTPPGGYCRCGAAIRDMDLDRQLGAIKTPTLVMVGEQDPSTPVADAAFIHQHIASSSLKIIPGAAHLSNVEQADMFNELLLAFIMKNNL